MSKNNFLDAKVKKQLLEKSSNFIRENVSDQYIHGTFGARRRKKSKKKAAAKT